MFLLQHNIPSRALSGFTSIRCDGWCQFEPSESIFEMVKGLNPHAPIYRNGFSKPLRVQDRLLKKVCELRGIVDLACYQALHHRVGDKFAIKETLDSGGISLEFPSIEEDLYRFLSCNCINHLKKGPLGLFQRKLPSGNEAKQS